MALFVLLLDFGTVPTVWHYCFFHFSIELWSSCDSVALLVCLWVYGTVLTVCHYLVFYWTLEMFRQCGIIGCSFVYWTLELIRQCDIICFSMGFWNSTDSVPLFAFLLYFETVLTG